MYVILFKNFQKGCRSKPKDNSVSSKILTTAQNVTHAKLKRTVPHET